MRQRLEHCPLAPVYHGRPICNQRIYPIEEMSVLPLHVFDRPRSDLLGQGQIILPITRKQDQRIDDLSRALDINRVAAIIIVFWTSVRLDEMLNKILKAS